MGEQKSQSYATGFYRYSEANPKIDELALHLVLPMILVRFGMDLGRCFGWHK